MTLIRNLLFAVLLALPLPYHAVPAKLTSGDIAGKKMDVATVEGSKISVDATKGVKVDDATATSPDIVASNGVIHVIDTLVMPN